MDYKVKYNKLVNAIKVLQKTNPSDEGIQNWVNDNVPELAESQDEKVREWVYNYFRSCFPTWIHPDITCGEILDWLEKQRTSYTERDVDDAYVEGMAFAKDELEKQNPVWTESDDEEFEIAINTLKGAGQYDSAAWLITLKQRYTWKPSEEQMEALLYETEAWDENSANGMNLTSLYNDLKKL